MRDALEFLREQGLVINQSGQWSMGTSSTFLPEESPFFLNRQIQWRLKAINMLQQKQPKAQGETLFYTGSMCLSQKDYQDFLAELRQWIAKMSKKVEKSESQTLACINIDAFRF